MRRTCLFRRLGLTVFTLLVGTGTLFGANISVTTTADSLTTNGACSLREAIRNANNNAATHPDCAAGQPGLDKIEVQPGQLNLTRLGAGEDFALTGDLDIRDDVVISGAGPGLTVVDANGNDRVFHIVLGAEVQIDNLTISGGTASQGGGLNIANGADVRLIGVDIQDNEATNSGGGVANSAGDLEITSVFFGNNTAGATGGGLHTVGDTVIVNSLFRQNEAQSAGGVYVAQGSMDIVDTDFDQNVALTAGGGLATVLNVLTTIDGGIWSSNQAPTGAAMQFNSPWELTGALVLDNVSSFGAGAIRSRSDGTVDQTTFLRNTGIFGGAIQHEVGALDVTSSTFDDNTAGGGGAIDNRDMADITDCDLINNQASVGGAVRNTGSLLLRRTTLDGNSASSDGGALWTDDGDSVINHSTISNNTAVNDGAGVMIADFLAEVDLYNTTVSTNVAQGRGGGVYVGGSFSFDFTTFANNRATGAGSGGAIYLDNGTIELKNSIMADSTPANCGGSGGGGSVVSAGYSMSDDGSCNLGGPSDNNNLDPQFMPLADYGGPTHTHSFTANSPARDTAAPNCMRLVAGFAADDQRQVVRPLEGDGIPGAECDRGAYEGPNPFSFQPDPVGDGVIAPPLLAARNDSFPVDAADIEWDVSTCISQDYHVLYGQLSQLSAYIVDGAICDIGPGVGSDTIGLPPGNIWFLVVGDDDFDIEGSWGTTPAGERNGTTVSGECSMTLRDNTGTCN